MYDFGSELSCFQYALNPSWSMVTDGWGRVDFGTIVKSVGINSFGPGIARPGVAVLSDDQLKEL